MARRRRNHLDARAWPGLSEGLVPATNKRLSEIMDWADAHDQDWLLDFLEARSKKLQQEGAAAGSRDLPPEDFLAVRFDLTPAQAKVLSAFLTGHTLQEISEAQQVSINTVRTHFVQIRAKLGARDQADVVRIALMGSGEAEGSTG